MRIDLPICFVAQKRCGYNSDCNCMKLSNVEHDELQKQAEGKEDVVCPHFEDRVAMALRKTAERKQQEQTQ